MGRKTSRSSSPPHLSEPSVQGVLREVVKLVCSFGVLDLLFLSIVCRNAAFCFAAGQDTVASAVGLFLYSDSAALDICSTVMASCLEATAESGSDGVLAFRELPAPLQTCTCSCAKYEDGLILAHGPLQPLN